MGLIIKAYHFRNIINFITVVLEQGFGLLDSKLIDIVEQTSSYLLLEQPADIIRADMEQLAQHLQG